MDLKTTGSQLGMDMIPPPTFAQSSISFNYAYSLSVPSPLSKPITHLPI